MTYTDYREMAKAHLGSYTGQYRGKEEAAYEQARATRGVGLAILALAEALRPEPMTVDLTINTEDVKTAVREGFQERRGTA